MTKLKLLIGGVNPSTIGRDEMSVGIYKITNVINGKSYIGQSKNIERRWSTHKRAVQLKDPVRYNYPLYQAIRKYGLENFAFEILEQCSVVELNEKECFWISYYNTFFKGYNATLGGGSTTVPKENILGIFEELQTTLNSHSVIAEKWGVSTEMVQGINTGRYWRLDIDYPIQKREMIPHLCSFKDCSKKIDRRATYCLEHYRELHKNSNKPTREELKSLIRKNSFTSLGKQFGVSDNAIRKWCKTYNLPFRITDIRNISDEDWDNI